MHPRADLMVERVARALEDSPLSEPDRGVLVDLARRVMTVRSEGYADEHHPALLHPLRAVLLLLETEDPDPRACEVALAADVDGGAVFGETSFEVATALAPLVRLDPDDRLEALVTGPSWLLAGWLALRLDHVRHLHMWAGPERTAREIAVATEIDGPLAARRGGRLHRAWTDWLGKARRYRLAQRADRWSEEEVRPR